VSDIWYSHLPYTTKRQKNPSVFQTCLYLVMGAIFDGLTVFVLYKCLPEKFNMHISDGPMTYLSQTVSVLGLVVADFNFMFWHGIILHGPLWFAHKGHHSNYRPTCLGGRVFDPIDYFVEMDITLLVLMAPLVFILKTLGMWNSYALSSTSVFGIYFSTIHHSGKGVIPAPFPGILPWSEAISAWACPEDSTVLSLHEGHHNFINCNYGAFGFADRTFGTFRHCKGWGEQSRKENSVEKNES